jgi:hypothetical protein
MGELHEETMKYLCLVFIDENKLKALSSSESQKLNDESLDYNDTLRNGGHFIAAEALQLPHSAATVRLQRGRPAVTDGPFAETKEQVGGFILIEATDLKEAVELASKIPAARFGAIEVRPIQELTRRAATPNHLQ